MPGTPDTVKRLLSPFHSPTPTFCVTPGWSLSLSGPRLPLCLLPNRLSMSWTERVFSPTLTLGAQTSHATRYPKGSPCLMLPSALSSQNPRVLLYASVALTPHPANQHAPLVCLLNTSRVTVNPRNQTGVSSCPYEPPLPAVKIIK